MKIPAVCAFGCLLAIFAGCSAQSASSNASAGPASVRDDLNALFRQGELTAAFTPGRVTNHGEGVVRVRTSHLDVYVTFQNAAGIAWPTAPGTTYTFYPSLDWTDISGRNTSGQMITVAKADVAEFVAGDNRQDICNGAAAEITDITVTDNHGATFEHVSARLTVFTIAPANAASGGVSLKSTGDDQSGDDSMGDSPDGGASDDDPKQCSANGAGNGGASGGSEAQSVHVLDSPIGVSGLLNGGCPMWFWNAGGCSGTCQRKVTFPLTGDCIWAGTPGTCTEHSREVCSARTGIVRTQTDCTCD
jgi:hypothetical protein